MLQEATRVQTIIREVHADLETPVSLYLKLRGQGPSFLLESVEGGERIARYSFIGIHPRAQYILRDEQVEIREGMVRRLVNLDPGTDPTRFLQAELARFPVQSLPGAPRFTGGLIGYLGYESVRYFEPSLIGQMKSADVPDGIYLLADTVVAFDNVRRTIFLIANVLDEDEASANARLDTLADLIAEPLPETDGRAEAVSGTVSNMRQEEFEDMVAAAREHIAAGDIFQVVLSQRFTRRSTADPFDVYRALRRLNPSPYMFFFDFGPVYGDPLYLIGSSPEMFVRLEDGTASLHPIAGTRPRGEDAAADTALAEELLADPKERAEHVMLVDLGRNDLGRVCEYGSVRVSDFFNIERYSHVMHIVSHVEGKMRPGLTAFDLIRAAFPAGTVSGAPKVRALEIIAQLEPGARGAYAGMVGYFGFDGSMDTCLAIRTLVKRGNAYSVQAGAGIVADSNPVNEYRETINKAGALLRALDLVEAAR